MAGEATATFWLTVNAEKHYGGYRLNTPKCTKNKPNVGPRSITMELTLRLPNILFERPALSAEISIDPEQVSAPDISADVINNIEEAARVHGIELTIHTSEAADDADDG